MDEHDPPRDSFVPYHSFFLFFHDNAFNSHAHVHSLLPPPQRTLFIIDDQGYVRCRWVLAKYEPGYGDDVQSGGRVVIFNFRFLLPHLPLSPCVHYRMVVKEIVSIECIHPSLDSAVVFRRSAPN